MYFVRCFCVNNDELGFPRFMGLDPWVWFGLGKVEGGKLDIVNGRPEALLGTMGVGSGSGNGKWLVVF